MFIDSDLYYSGHLKKKTKGQRVGERRLVLFYKSLLSEIMYVQTTESQVGPAYLGGPLKVMDDLKLM